MRFELGAKSLSCSTFVLCDPAALPETLAFVAPLPSVETSARLSIFVEEPLPQDLLEVACSKGVEGVAHVPSGRLVLGGADALEDDLSDEWLQAVSIPPGRYASSFGPSSLRCSSFQR